jgi:hypothetical protein
LTARPRYAFDGSGLGLGHNFAAIVLAALAADMMRALLLAAIRAFVVRGRRQRIMCATHIPP